MSTDDKTTVDVGENLAEGLSAATSPMAALAAAYNHSPSPILRDFINGAVMEILVIQLPRLQNTVLEGPAIPADEVIGEKRCASVFSQAMDYGRENAPAASMPSATIIDIGAELAETIDRGVKRVLLDDTHANRMAHATLIQLHAQVVATLNELALDEEQKAIVERVESGAELN